MPDSLKVISESIKDHFERNLDIIDKVDAFYNNAWDKLVLFGSILFALVGVFVPIVIQWYQRRTLKLSEDSLKLSLKKELKEELTKEIEQEFQKNEQNLKIITASANSKILFSQAKFSTEKNSFRGALGECVAAGYSSMECNDFRILQEILEFVSENCLTNLSIEEINDLKIANICDFQLFLEDITKKDDRGMFHSKIGEIKVKITKLPKSIKEKPTEKPKEEKA